MLEEQANFLPYGFFFYIKQIRHNKSINYAFKFKLAKHFMMQFLQTLDMISD